MKTVLKVLAALAAITGIVYIVATYGDKIVAWAKNLLSSCPFCNECDIVEEEAPVEEVPAEEAVEETPAEETPVEEPVEEVAEEVVIEENAPVAEEADFEE